ncbi:hypothetical protein LVY72_07645 [Arthrobacter sp. I2-34]|uniref:Uncharacterized protein n=1 Tax=Arthrobacter hankyongi TaxID=2904801 RepID=A0ABS9L545_9MICC|nr:hypothetical protein [Arthrobacter hankyongi]MCG2621790.1 hypothetical protein [Arthrobacter hankyongi]
MDRGFVVDEPVHSWIIEDESMLRPLRHLWPGLGAANLWRERGTPP